MQHFNKHRNEFGYTTPEQYLQGAIRVIENPSSLKKIETEENVKMLGEDVDVRPTTTETCPECGNDKAYYEIKQTRSADEAPTRIFKCSKCKHTWRAYH